MNKIKILLFVLILGSPFTMQSSDYFNEDWEWVYGFSSIRYEEYMFLYHMKYCGTTEINGVEWHNFTSVGYEVLNGSTGEVEYYEDKYRNTFLIRETDNIFYMRLPEKDSPDCSIPPIRWDIEDEEVCIGNYNLDTGDVFTTFSNMGVEVDLNIGHVSNLTIQGESKKVYYTQCNGRFSEFTFVEGIGPLDNGCLPYILKDILNISVPTYAANNLSDMRFPIFNESTGLLRIETTNGEIVFQPEWLEVKNIFDEATSPNDQIFDIYGHRVDNPQPGSIYIRNGKKFIAR